MLLITLEILTINSVRYYGTAWTIQSLCLTEQIISTGGSKKIGCTEQTEGWKYRRQTEIERKWSNSSGINENDLECQRG